MQLSETASLDARASARKGPMLRKSGDPAWEPLEQEDPLPEWDQAPSQHAKSASSPKWRSLVLLYLGTALLAGAWITYASLEALARDRQRPAVTSSGESRQSADIILPQPLVDEAIAVMDAFLQADSVETKLANIRNPARVAALLRDYYATHDLVIDGIESLILLARQRRHGMEYFVAKVLTTRGREEHFILFRDSSGTFMVDWETFVGYNPVSWNDLMTKHPAQPLLLRAYARKGQYYNYAFQDHRRYHCVELEEPNGDAVLFGYVSPDTENGMALIRGVTEASRDIPIMVEVSYPETPASGNQVSITRVLRFSWITPDEEPLND